MNMSRNCARSRMCLASRRAAPYRAPAKTTDLGVIAATSWYPDADGHYEFAYCVCSETEFLDTFSDALWLQWGWTRREMNPWTSHTDARVRPIDHLDQDWLVFDIEYDHWRLDSGWRLFNDRPRVHR